MSSVVVVGGGVSGLHAASQLAAAGYQVTVLEASGRWGGKLAAIEIDGVRLDTGAESVLARRPEAVGLIAQLGLGRTQVHPSEAKPRLLVGGELHPLPPSLAGVPTDLEQLRPLLSASGYQQAVLSAAVEDPMPADVPIGTAVDERFGPEVTDRLLEPLLGGVYAGQSRQLSFDAVAHELFTRARNGGSLLEHARALARPSGTPVFAGLVGGVSAVADALVEDLLERGATLRSGVTVRDLSRSRSGAGFRLGAQRGEATEWTTADAVVLAAPASATARLLSKLTSAARRFGQIPYASMAVLTLVVRGLDSQASGVLVPPGELPTIKAMTHSSVKWEWVGQRAEATWGPGAAVVRASIGRLGEESLLQLPDDALLRRTWTEAADLPGWAGAELMASAVTRWGGALPQYRVGHRDLVSKLREQLSAIPGLSVAGAALDGVGIAACLGSADQAVTKIMADLGGRHGGMGDQEHPEESGR